MGAALTFGAVSAKMQETISVIMQELLVLLTKHMLLVTVVRKKKNGCVREVGFFGE